MNFCVGYSKKGQLKIQQMAFVLVFMMIFFGMIGMIFVSMRMASLENDVVNLQDEETLELVRKLSAHPEFAYTIESKCANCIDFDKVLILKEREGYKGFWRLDYLAVEKIYPYGESEECTRGNYPDCQRVTIIDGNKEGAVYGAFVSLCRWDSTSKNHKCELGRILASGKGVGS